MCFHTELTSHIEPLDEAKRGLRLLAEAGMKKINISGGEPFLKPKFLGEIIKYCKKDLNLESTGIICNGSKVTEKWLDEYGQYLDIMGVSCDSFDDETNMRIGRSEKKKTVHTRNMNYGIEELAPFRWKVFQVLLLEGENKGPEALRNAQNMTITDEQFKAFLARHQSQKCLVPEDNKAMESSYLLVDEFMRFLNCEGGKKVPGRSILKVGVEAALKEAGWHTETFVERGGIFEWERKREEGLSW
ncbi:radical SAM enzyme [Agrocybe pediades]|nr:radical SAM enzyme [Agrocybe pediades]